MHKRPVHQAPPLRSFAESRRSCIAASLGTMFRYRRRLIAAWPSDWSFPLIARRRSWGSLAPFAGLLPHTGGGSFLIGPGPPACSSSRRAPINFRRVDSPLFQTEEKHESRHYCGGITCAWIGFWALTPVCGPCPDVSAGTAPNAKPPGIVPALGLSSFRDAGTRCAFARARPRSNHQAANTV